MEEQRILIGLDLSLASQEIVELLLEDPPDQGIYNEIARANESRPEILEILANHPDTPEDVFHFISGVLHLPAERVTTVAKKEIHEEEKAQNIFQRIQRLTVTEKIQLALRGGREIRGILAKDTNKEVVLCVLDNAKITESEIEMFAQSRHSMEEILRRISKNREWMKKYEIAVALVTNPKTPAGIAVTHVSSLRTKDLVKLEKNKNISEAVRAASKKVLHMRKPR